MPADEIIFNHPPLTEVRCEVTFPNNLDVADKRSQFYQLIKEALPLVVIPEQSKMTYDMADYALHSENMAERLEIGMSYFRFITTSYPGFRKFRVGFLGALNLFSDCYGLKGFSSFAMTFQNKLHLDLSQHGLFKDVFRLEVRLPEELQSELFAGKGLLVVPKTRRICEHPI